jgi:trimeric autotransporter adhesin
MSTVIEKFIVALFLLIVVSSLNAAGVVDGSPVNAATTNSAFLFKNGNDSTSFNIALQNTTDTTEGTSIAKAQREFNALNSFIGNIPNQVKTITPPWSSNNFGTSGDNLFQRISAIDSAVLNKSLTSAHIFVGNVSNISTDVAMTGDVSINNAGATAVGAVGTSSASNIHSAELAANAATDANTVSTIIKRSASGNFSAGTITAALSGNATTAGTATNFSGSLTGDVTGTQGSTAVATVGTSSAANVHAAELLANAATNANTISAIVKRDGSGNFSAGQISELSQVFRGSGSGTVTISPPANPTPYALVLPSAQSSPNYFVQNDGSGNLSWQPGSSGGVSAVGTIDSQAKSTNGAVISGTTIYMQTMDAEAGSGGKTGLVPPTSAGDAVANKFLKANATWAVPSVSVSQQTTKLNTANGHGSTNTKIRSFTNIQYATGSGNFTYADSAANGGSITILKPCTVFITYSDSFTGAAFMGLSLNSNQLTTNVSAITSTDILNMTYMAGTSLTANVSWSGQLTTNDVIRAHTTGNAGGDAYTTMTIYSISY